jgi:hypothetical protein
VLGQLCVVRAEYLAGDHPTLRQESLNISQCKRMDLVHKAFYGLDQFVFVRDPYCGLDEVDISLHVFHADADALLRRFVYGVELVLHGRINRPHFAEGVHDDFVGPEGNECSSAVCTIRNEDVERFCVLTKQGHESPGDR